MTVDHESVESLVSGAAGGSQVAFASLVDAYDADLRALAWAICHDRDAAADAVQEAWLIAWRKLGSLRSAQAVRPWLMAVTANQARITGRRGRRRAQVELQVAGQPLATAPAPGDDLDLHAALGRLDQRDRALLALTCLAGLTSEETGRILRLSPEGVRTRKARLLKRLREELT